MTVPAIRVATPSDAAAVSALFAASYPALLAVGYDAALLKVALPLMTVAQPKLLESGTFFVSCQDDGNLTACGGWTFEQPGTGHIQSGTGHIRHFATHPGWTRRGLAAAILDRCFDDARRAGADRVECQSTLTAAAFYAASGFKTVSPIDVILPPNIAFPALLMRCELDSGG
jgi:N-acetylglutamate synthase-like GNAT family acetyltransferase